MTIPAQGSNCLIMQVYIQYIVEHYDRLPANIVFMHAHRSAWHRGDALGLLPRLRWGAVPFANLRYEVPSVRLQTYRHAPRRCLGGWTARN